MIKKVIINLFAFIVLFAISMPVFADAPGYSAMSQINNASGGSSMVKEAGNQIIGTVYIVGVIASVGSMMIMGIRFMLASPEGKADLKAQLVPYLIGAILIFAAVNVMALVEKMAGSIK